MKKLCVYFMAAALACTGVAAVVDTTVHVEAADAAAGVVVSETTEFFEDGSSLTITVTQDVGAVAYGSVYSKSGSKTYVYRNGDNEEVLSFKLHGTFSVNSGVGATCTSTSYTTSISDTAWQLDSASSYASGNQAIGDATFVKKRFGIKFDTKNSHIVLTCDENGTLK